MSDNNLHLTHNGHGNHDEEWDILYTKHLLKGKKHSVDLNISSDINKELLKTKTWGIKKDITKKPSLQLASANVSLSNAIDIIDTFDRPADAIAEGTYARSGAYAVSPENKPGKRIPKAGAFAEAGVGLARAEFSIFEAEARGPNALAGAEATVVGAGAIARAELASASAKVGPFGVKLALGVDTGVSIGPDGFEAKVLGTGILFGPKTSISFLGSEVSCSVM